MTIPTYEERRVGGEDYEEKTMEKIIIRMGYFYMMYLNGLWIGYAETYEQAEYTLEKAARR